MDGLEEWPLRFSSGMHLHAHIHRQAHMHKLIKSLLCMNFKNIPYNYAYYQVTEIVSSDNLVACFPVTCKNFGSIFNSEKWGQKLSASECLKDNVDLFLFCVFMF